MKIGSINQRVIENIYKSNKVEEKAIKNEKIDTIQISDLGKYLSEVNNKKEEINIEKVNELKKKIDNGTYRIDSKDIAKKIIEHMRGEK
ncbi:flagellar biosynthesis anti-sigma factor FlgM [Clostridium sp. CCUG 7971]|uniref:flagellar biosynthesis anti-sigma factor FlgM n=1 Tax=Clostridium sp. CCUG 7971 TaxID=2811414 RepID=UPI001ABA487A|nr:flagellar biosynthesis anti-sigma factor FlgM [Clostridium sp. CCUG 7971]MBO3446327.1 flagellar biosynthesis anti-sigma factor FlgM [Clostridium sp. CCUG 7971]